MVGVKEAIIAKKFLQCLHLHILHESLKKVHCLNNLLFCFGATLSTFAQINKIVLNGKESKDISVFNPLVLAHQ